MAAPTGKPATGLQPPPPLVLSTNNASEDWEVWLQQYQWYAVATGVASCSQKVQAAAFMNAIGPQAVRIYRTFKLTPAEAEDVAVIKRKFTERFAPIVRNEVLTSYMLSKLQQKPGESLDEFLDRARTLFRKCGFEKLRNMAEWEDRYLRDIVVRGVLNEELRMKLLAESKLPLAKALDICRAHEHLRALEALFRLPA